jgi:hypothetical protein
MKLKVMMAAVAVTVVAMIAPAASSAQTPLTPVCDSLLGSRVINLGVAEVKTCYEAQQVRKCTLTDTINVLNLVRIRTGLCLDLSTLLDSRTATVRGVVSVHLLPNAAKAKRAKVRRRR